MGIVNFNGRKVTKAKDFANGLATLEINTVDKRASGFGGCNRINGEVVTNGSNIKFDKIISTKMYCEGVKENDFMNALRNATSYNFADGILRLNGNGTTLATFIRPAE